MGLTIPNQTIQLLYTLNMKTKLTFAEGVSCSGAGASALGWLLSGWMDSPGWIELIQESLASLNCGADVGLKCQKKTYVLNR